MQPPLATGRPPRPLSAVSYVAADQSLERVDRALDAALAQELDVGEHPLGDARENGGGHDVGELARGNAVLSLADVAQLDVRQVERHALSLEARVGHGHLRAPDREALDHQAVARALWRLGRGARGRTLRLHVALDALLDRVEVGAAVAALVDDHRRVDDDLVHQHHGPGHGRGVERDPDFAEARRARRAESGRIADLDILQAAAAIALDPATVTGPVVLV